MKENSYEVIRDINDFKDPRARQIAREFHLAVEDMPYLFGTMPSEMENLEKGREVPIMKKLAATSAINYELTKTQALEIRERDGDETVIPRTLSLEEHEEYGRSYHLGAECVKSRLGYIP